MNQRTIYFWLICLLFTFEVDAQTTKAKGLISDEQNQPIVGAIISVFQKNTNDMLRGITSDEQGQFLINLDWDKEKLRISAFGYKDVEVIERTEDISVILKPLSVELAEVVVNAKSIVTQKNDRLIFSIANSNLTKGNNTMDLLRFTPLMQVDNKRLIMAGKSGVQLYINGRKSNLSPDAVQGYLQGLPADKIDKIEVITSPGSEYRLAANEGIINLVLKKDESQGLKGTFNLQDTQSHYNSQDGNLYLDYQKGKTNFSASLYGNNYLGYYKTDTRYSFFDEGLQNAATNVDAPKDNTIGGNFSIDYQLSEKQTISAMVDGYYLKRDNSITATTLYNQLNSSVIDSTLYSNNQGDLSQYILTANLNYRLLTDDKGSNLSVDVDYLRSNGGEQSFLDYSRIVNASLSDPYRRFKQKSEDDLVTYSGRVEYTHQFDKSNKLKTGIEFYRTNSIADFYYGNYQTSDYVNDPQKSNHFDYDETYGAAFATYDRTWGSKFSSTIGVRGEYVYNKGVQEANNETISKSRFDVIPNLSLMYNISQEHQLSYNLSSFMSRPSFSSFNPFRYYVSPTVYRENNPNLKPGTFLINSLRYVMKQHYIFMFNYMYMGDCSNVFMIPVEGGLTRIGRFNYGNAHFADFTFSWNDSFFEGRLYVNASATGTYSRYKGEVLENKIDVSNFSYNCSLNAGVLISKRYNWNLTANYMYRSPMLLAQEDVSHTSSFGAEAKKVFSNGIALKFGGRNLFYATDKRSKVYENYSYYSEINSTLRSYYISVSVPFGRKKVSGAQGRSGSSSNVQSRVR